MSLTKLIDILLDIKLFIYGGIISLPLALAGSFLVIGLCTCHYGILFFLLGFLVIVPLIVYIIDLFFLNSNKNILNQCNLVYPFGSAGHNINQLNVSSESSESSKYSIVSYWTAMVSFFFGYILMNAIKLYTMDTKVDSMEIASNEINDTKVNNRKYRSIISMIMIIVIGISIFSIRAFMMKCEMNNMTEKVIYFVTIFSFIGVGILWYYMLSKIYNGKMSDIFGISNRLLPPAAINNDPIACLPPQQFPDTLHY